VKWKFTEILVAFSELLVFMPPINGSLVIYLFRGPVVST
jgi:hypothetical protein